MSTVPRLRILQILEATLGGTARHVLDLCSGLQADGHEVHLLYNSRKGRMDEIFGRGLSKLADSGALLTTVDMNRAVGPSDLSALRAIRAYARAHGPFDIIHGHSSKGGAYARLAALGLPGARFYTPNAFITTNPQLGPSGRLIYGFVECILGKLGHGLIAVSQEEFEHALSLGIPRRFLSLVPNGTDVPPAGDGALVRRSLGLPEDALIIGFVGRMVPQKDPENLLRAFAELAPRNAAARLAMVGDGPLLGSSRKMAEDLGISSRVHWLGVQDGPSVMPAFDVFALPSLYEGLPYVLIEAMSRGLPIVTTEIGGARTLVEEGENGYVIPSGNPTLLAAALEMPLADATLRRRLGERSRELSALFSAQRMVRGNLEAYAAGLRNGRG